MTECYFLTTIYSLNMAGARLLWRAANIEEGDTVEISVALSIYLSAEGLK